MSILSEPHFHNEEAAFARLEPQTPLRMVDSATVTGRLYALIEEPSGLLKARIRPRGGNTYIACNAEGSIGRKLREFFMDAVRVQGRGTFFRSDDGNWQCESVQIQEVQAVKNVPLREAINALRTIEATWSDDPLGDWDELEERNGAA